MIPHVTAECGEDPVRMDALFHYRAKDGDPLIRRGQDDGRGYVVETPWPSRRYETTERDAAEVDRARRGGTCERSFNEDGE